jgi:beta-phosphoglucomutase-like phosphatase (HAD superfamily)
MLDAIIFDGEGVVFDTEGVWDLAQAEFLQLHGKKYDRGHVKPLLAGRSQRDGIRILKQKFGLEGSVDSLVDERQSLFWKHLSDRIRLVDGFEDFISRIGLEFKRAVATSMARNVLDLVVPQLHAERYFGSHIYSESDIRGPGKPAPDLFLYVATQIGSKPANCVVIEDSPVGIEAARAAGMASIGLASTFSREALSAADLVVNDWSGLDAKTLMAVMSGAQKGIHV